MNKENAKIISALEVMFQTEGWEIVRRIFNENISVLENQILTKISNETKEELSDAEIDKLRIRRNYLKEVLEMPEKYVEMLKAKDEGKSLDPYD